MTFGTAQVHATLVFAAATAMAFDFGRRAGLTRGAKTLAGP